jgi:NACalpha-BTF3-like transcription factor
MINVPNGKQEKITVGDLKEWMRGELKHRYGAPGEIMTKNQIRVLCSDFARGDISGVKALQGLKPELMVTVILEGLKQIAKIQGVYQKPSKNERDRALYEQALEIIMARTGLDRATAIERMVEYESDAANYLVN